MIGSLLKLKGIIDNFFNNLKIGPRLLLHFLLITLVPLAIVSFIEYNNSVETIKKEVMNNLKATVERKAGLINNYFDEREKHINILVHDPLIKNSLGKLITVFENKGINSPEYISVDKELRTFLTYYKEGHGYYDISLISAAGDIVFTVIQGNDFGTNLLTGPYSNTELSMVFNNSRSELVMGISDFKYYSPSDEPAAFITAPILKEKKLLGVVAIQLNTEEIYKLAQDYAGLGKTGETVIALKTNNNAVFLTPLRHDLKAGFKRKVIIGSENALPIQEAVQGVNGSGIFKDYRGEEVLAVWRYLPHLRWGMVVKIDTQEAYDPIRNLMKMWIIVGIITVIVVLIISFFVSKSISNPINKLHKGVQIIGTGNLDYKVGTETKDEIGHLSRSFDQMVFNLKKITDKLNYEIAERKLIAQELIESEERFRGLYENSMLGIFRSNPEGEIIMANPAALSLLGYANLEEISNIKVEDGYCDPSERKKFKEIMDSEGAVQGFEIKWKRPDGTIVDLRESTRTITDRDGKVVYYEGTFEDITERKRAEKALIKAKEKAEEMNLLKSNFLANMSHELRTPLVGILGYAEIIQSEIADDDQKEMINAITTSGNRLMNTLNSILDISKVEAEKNEIKLTPMEITPIVIKTAEAFKSEAENKNLVLKTIVVNNNVVSPVDENLLKQIISNLVGNAIKYTEKGIVEIIVESSEKMTESVIKVIDTGIGIRVEDQKVIFNEFRQASEGLGRHFEGAGLGLTITKRFVELMNGEISLESELGKGSVFTVTFPSAIAEPGNKEINPEETNLASTNEQRVEIETAGLPRILLVDDDWVMGDAVKRILKTICLLDIAVNGNESILMAGKNNYDIILMDINLGTGINGLKAASAIRKITGYENKPIVAITAYAMAEDKEKFLAEGCTHYLSKPFSGKDIIGMINKILRRNNTVQLVGMGI